MILWDRKMLRENASWPQALLPAPEDPRPPWGRAGPACCSRGTPWPPRRSSRCASAPRGSDGSGTSHEHHFPGRCHIFNPCNTFLLRYHRNKKILYVFSVFHQEYFTARKMRWLSISPVEQAKKNGPHAFQHHNPFFKCCIVRTPAATTRPKLSRCRLALLVVHNGFALKCILFHALC